MINKNHDSHLYDEMVKDEKIKCIKEPHNYCDYSDNIYVKWKLEGSTRNASTDP